MTATSPVPHDDLRRVADAQARLEILTVDLSDDVVAQPTVLPGWSVGHLLTHVARNADSHLRRAEAAARGEVIEQYQGGFEGRAREIESGATRPAKALVADVHDSAEALRRCWNRLPLTVWDRPTRDVLGRERPMRSLVGRRWQELEVHTVDLRLGATHRDWTDEFVTEWLPRLREGVDQRVPVGSRVPSAPPLDDRNELAWLYGRIQPDGYPPLAPWG